MAFCNNCGNQIESGTVCDECKAAPAAEIGKADAFKENAKETVAAIQKNMKEGFSKMTSSSMFKYYEKRIFNTAATQPDDNYRFSLYAIGAFYGTLLLTLLVRGLDLMFGLGGFILTMSGQKFGVREAERFIDNMSLIKERFPGLAGGVIVSVLVLSLLSVVVPLVLYKLDKEKTVKDFVIGYANRLVLSTLLLIVVLLITVALRTLSMGTGIPAIMFVLAVFLNNMAGLTLMIGETKFKENIKFYIYSAAIFVQFILNAYFMSTTLSGLSILM